MRFQDQPTSRELAQQFVQLLYSRPAAREAQRRMLAPDEMSSGWRSFFESVDFEAVRVEQRVRVTDLILQFRQTTPSLRAAVGDEEMDRLVTGFCDAPMLWQPKGRSLAEHFCLYASERLAEQGDGFGRDAARLDGVVSGLSVAPTAPTPWHEHRKADGATRELMIVQHTLFEGDGRPVTFENVDALRRLPSSHKALLVSAVEGGGTDVQCFDLSTKEKER